MADLGAMPYSNDYLSSDKIGQCIYPLSVFYCEKCHMVQTGLDVDPKTIFNNEYKYFSSYSASWLKHAKNYVDMIIKRLDLNEKSRVAEIASNDGYLLQFFLPYGMHPVGIEPAVSAAVECESKGIDVIKEFLGSQTALYIKNDYGTFDLLIGNNVLAHVPDINDFIEGVKILLDVSGTVTFEFPHLLEMIRHNEFDTIYHEHYSYLSISFLKGMFKKHSLEIYDIEKLPTHGGSLRLYVKHMDKAGNVAATVDAILDEEQEYGLMSCETYTKFGENMIAKKYRILKSIADIRGEGKKLVAYGAAAKGNTLLNYCGIGRETIDFVVDKNPHKQGNFLPGTYIPILSEEEIVKSKPDIIVIIPWNLRREIAEQLSYAREWGCRFMTLIPEVSIF